MTPQKWTVKCLSELTENFDSLRIPVKGSERISGKYPYYGASGIVDYIDKYIFDGDYLLVAEDGENLRTLKTPIAFLARGKFWVNNHAHIMRGNSEADTCFLAYALANADISGYLTGSTMPKLTQGNMNRIPILAPPLDEQKAIAHILGTLDDKIELNQQMNQTLEAIARAIFKSWFVDFDPVRAKLEGRQPANMDAETAALFPAEFEDGGEGKGAIELIPKGWQVGRLDDLLVLQRGFDLPTSQRTPGMYPVIAASGFSGTHSEFRVEGPGVVTGRSGVLGKVFFVHEDFWALNTALWVKEFRISRPIHAYHLLQGLELATFNAGSAVPTLNRNHVHGLPMVLPPIEVVQAFEALVTPIFQRCRANEKEAFTLATIRDALLPKLLSGELRVKDAEKLVEVMT